jgi:hypothetical protein
MSLRSTLKVLVGVSLAALGSLLLLELSARIFLFGLAGLHPGRVGSVHPLWETGFLHASTHGALGYEFKPDIDGYFKLARLRTNSRGLRDREYSLEKPPDTFRVAVLGASFALPAGVEIEDSFHSVLERRLTAESSSPTYEFINFAVGTYGPRQSLAMLRLRALDYDPDLVLLAVTRLSMPQLPGAWDRPLPLRRSLQRRNAFYESFLVKLLKVRFGWTRVGMLQAGPRRSRDGVPSVIEKLGEFSRTTGIPVVVVRLEFDAEAPFRADRAVRAAIQTSGLHFLDTRHAFAGTAPREFWIYEIDPHPDARAHAIFADVLARFLREKGLIEP